MFKLPVFRKTVKGTPPLEVNDYILSLFKKGIIKPWKTPNFKECEKCVLVLDIEDKEEL